MSKIALYLNPRAAGFDQTHWERTLRKLLFRHELQFLNPTSVAELKLFLKQNKQDHVDTVFLVGGDGTVNTVLPELIETDLNIMVIPAGTANDLACDLGLSKNISHIIKAFQYKTIRHVDVINVNQKYFLTVGGIGLANNVVSKVNQFRKRSSKFKDLMNLTGDHIYGMMLGTELAMKKLERSPLRIQVGDDSVKEYELEASMVYICNQSTLGGNFELAPGTKNDDGRFRVLIFSHPNKMSLIKAIWSIRAGNFPEEDPYLLSFETNSLKLDHLRNIKLPFFGDGEELERSNHFDFSILDHKLKFLSLKKQFKYETTYSLDEISRI